MPRGAFGNRAWRALSVAVSFVALFASLAACSGGDSNQVVTAGVDHLGNPLSNPNARRAKSSSADIADEPTSRQDAARLLQQASFGPTPAQIDSVASTGSYKWLVDQFEQPGSRYRYTLNQNVFRQSIHVTSRTDYCSQFSGTAYSQCWRDWYSVLPVQWDFFRQAVSNQDQLRQRVALALSQVFVVSAQEVNGTYGIALYQQMLRDEAFSNFRTLLEKVTRSPVMGQYLNLVNNEAADPNENFARELLQLFSIGACQLRPDGSNAAQSGNECQPTYDNAIVRNYAFSLSGWTYPAGGINPWCKNNCDDWGNPVFYRGDMVPVQAQHDAQARELLSGIVAPAGRSAEQGLQAVLDSIMAHPNVAPFIGRQLIQFLVTSNPSPAYISRVSAAFNAGRFRHSQGTIGSGEKGDMRATIAAILLDREARDSSTSAAQNFGRLREPVLVITGPLRALGGYTDGVALAEYGWSKRMGQSVFASPTVFNFYSPMQPLSGTDLVAPRFGIDNVNTSLARINYANALVYWWYRANKGSQADSTVPDASGTRVDYSAIENLIAEPVDSIRAVDALSELLVDSRLTATEKNIIVKAMNEWSEEQDSWLKRADLNSNWRREQVRTALYLILSSPQYQVQR